MKFGRTIDLDYSDVVSMCNSLADRIVEIYQPDLIVGLSRGGLIPAVHISHRIEVPMRPVVWQTRDGGVKQLDDEVMKALHEDKKTVVFVDDINDSGKTFNEVKDTYCGQLTVNNNYSAYFVSLVEKKGSDFHCDEAELTIDDKRWIIFPWE